jgi:hypothetical protein
LMMLQGSAWLPRNDLDAPEVPVLYLYPVQQR